MIPCSEMSGMEACVISLMVVGILITIGAVLYSFVTLSTAIVPFIGCLFCLLIIPLFAHQLYSRITAKFWKPKGRVESFDKMEDKRFHQ